MVDAAKDTRDFAKENVGSLLCSQTTATSFEIIKACQAPNSIEVNLRSNGDKAIFGFVVVADSKTTTIMESLDPFAVKTLTIEGTSANVELVPYIAEDVTCENLKVIAEVNIC